MTLGLYKPGLGYWVRVITASFCATILVAAVAWLWAQVGAIQLPTGRYSLTVDATVHAQPPAPESTVSLLTATSETPIGSARVDSYEVIGGNLATLTLRSVDMTGGAVFEQASRVQSADPSAFSGTINASMRIPIIEPIYLQASVAGIMLLAGGAVIYLFVGVRRSSVDFLIATDGEMKKVNWSSRKDVIGSTWVVISASFLIAAGLFVVDIAFAQFFEWIKVLER